MQKVGKEDRCYQTQFTIGLIKLKITMVKKLGRVGRNNFFLLFLYLPGRAVGGILVIRVCWLVVE